MSKEGCEKGKRGLVYELCEVVVYLLIVLFCETIELGAVSHVDGKVSR